MLFNKKSSLTLLIIPNPEETRGKPGVKSGETRVKSGETTAIHKYKMLKSLIMIKTLLCNLNRKPPFSVVVNRMLRSTFGVNLIVWIGTVEIEYI